MAGHRLDVDFLIEWQTAWHVGSGFASAGVNRLIKRWPGSRVPYVPGSQIKGVLREQCERLAAALGLPVASPHAVDRDTEQALVRSFVPLAQSELIVDRLFGTRYDGDCLFVDNAVPVDSHAGYAVTDVRTRTSIDRITGTVLERRLFSSELADGRIKLRSAVHGRHPASVLTQDGDSFPLEYALLIAGLISIDALGGDRGAGLGRCRITIQQVRWQGKQVPLDECLKSFADEPEWGDLVQVIWEEKRVEP